ncbi:MAG: hypothetical protein KTR18_05280 [Acidiferrobacterales bacterium]|nr:hypothetical protein [Acidiferrobacterales bacterium]
MKQMKKSIALVMALAFYSMVSYAELIPGEKKVFLDTPGGESLQIGTLRLTGNPSNLQIQFTLDESQFSDQFLSMRPFKCIDGTPMVCRLAYPYEKKNQIQPDDFGDLEYEFLFIARSPKEYGIDPYNGRYYVIKEVEGNLIGEIRAVDLNILAAPPDDGNLRPITSADLDPLEAENERFPILRIE